MSRSTSLANIVTYRLAASGRMTYVKPADSYAQAVAFAKDVFPELAKIPQNRISFTISVLVGGKTNTVEIGAMAWSDVMASLSQFEIIDLVVAPEIIVEDADAPPRYLDSQPSSTSDEKQDARPLSPSPRTASSWFKKRLA